MSSESGKSDDDRIAACLEVADDTGASWVYQMSVETHRVTIGRCADRDVCLTDAFCARTHAIIIHEQGRFLLEDLDSINGTSVNGKRRESHELKDGDTIAIGSTTIRFRTKPPK